MYHNAWEPSFKSSQETGKDLEVGAQEALGGVVHPSIPVTILYVLKITKNPKHRKLKIGLRQKEKMPSSKQVLEVWVISKTGQLSCWTVF